MDLECTLSDLTIVPLPDEVKDSKVQDYVLRDVSWDWNKTNQYLVIAVQPFIATVVYSKEDSGMDRLIRKWTNSGQFSATTACGNSYNFKRNQVDPKWSAVWAWKGPDKIKTFL